MQTPKTPINRTQNWLIAILSTTTLVCVGVVITLLNSQSNNIAQVSATPPSNDQTKTAVMTVSQNAIPTANGQALTEQNIRTTANKLLPAQTIKAVEKVNYEGQLAYQVMTDKAQLYLNAYTGNVISIVPLAQPAVQTLQVAYQPTKQERHEGREHEEHDEGEEDDD